MTSTVNLRALVNSTDAMMDFHVDDFSFEKVVLAPTDVTSAADGDWNVGATWSGGVVPNSIDNVTIDHSITVKADETINNVMINNDTGELGQLKINAGQSLTVNGNLTVTGTDTNGVLMVSSSTQFSSLIVEGTSSGIGKYRRFTAQANLAGGTNDLISAPFAGDTFLSVKNSSTLYENPADATQYLFGPFDNTTGTYGIYNTTDDGATVIASGKGYRAGTDSGGNVVFTGTVETADVAVPITFAAGNYGSWNLIGNPYTSYLDFDSFITRVIADDILEAGFVAVYGYDSDSADGSIWTIWTIWDDNSPTGNKIAPGQGFFVSSKAAGGTVTFTPAMRTIGATDDFISGRTINNSVKAAFKLSKNSMSYPTNLYFTEGKTRGMDYGNDTAAYANSAGGIYTSLVEGDGTFQLYNQALPYSDYSDVVVPLGIKADAGEQVSVSLDATETTLPTDIYVYLEDNVTNTWTLLNDGDYTFTPSTAISDTGRFYVHFQTQPLSTPEFGQSNLHVYVDQQNKSLVVKGLLQDATTIVLYDLQGRVVLNSEFDSNTTENSLDIASVNTGIYIVGINNGVQQKTQKVINVNLV